MERGTRGEEEEKSVRTQQLILFASFGISRASSSSSSFHRHRLYDCCYKRKTKKKGRKKNVGERK